MTSAHMLNDNLLIDDINPFVLDPPGSVRRTSNFEDFTRLKDEPGGLPDEGKSITCKKNKRVGWGAVEICRDEVKPNCALGRAEQPARRMELPSQLKNTRTKVVKEIVKENKGSLMLITTLVLIAIALYLSKRRR